MITGTSGRACRARGRSSMPLMPGMLTSERMRMSLAASAAPTRCKASGALCANSMTKRDGAQLFAELLAEELGDVRLVVDDQDQRAHVLRSGARQHDGELRVRAGLGRNLDRPAMLLDHDIVAEREAEPGAFAGGLGGEERIEHLRLHLVGNPGSVVANGDFDAVSRDHASRR